MNDIITGGIYAVDLNGTESYEFKGIHPALIVRMLKENDMYYVVPLTTYTKERWEKCKKKGFGTRLISTNSIARIDKLNIVSRKQIQSRYYNDGHLVIPSIEEIEKVLSRVEEYINLSNKKTKKEYIKTINQYNDFEIKINYLLNKEYNKFPYSLKFDEDITFDCPCEDLSFISLSDVKDIINKSFNNTKVLIRKQNAQVKISIKVNGEKLLTFSQAYDRFIETEG